MSQDLDQLTALNHDYVASVQNCDVKRFDEILAPEFFCSNPDKTLVDRAAFLEQTARPITIRNLHAYDVIIRIMADFAPPPATPPPTANRPPAAIPIAGPRRTESGWQCPRTCRGEAT